MQKESLADYSADLHVLGATGPIILPHVLGTSGPFPSMHAAQGPLGQEPDEGVGAGQQGFHAVQPPSLGKQPAHANEQHSGAWSWDATHRQSGSFHSLKVASQVVASFCC